MKYPTCLLALSLLTASTASAEEVVRIHPAFDSGRVATNDLSTTDFQQWSNGTGSSRANNVGWNESRGIWYSFIRFSGRRQEGTEWFGLELSEWFERLDAAGSITLRGDVNWLEINPDFPGEAGVDVSVWLIPGMDIAEGSLPGFGNTWPWNYANRIKVETILVEDMIPLRASWDDAEFDPVDTRDKMEYHLQIDLTGAVKSAIADGLMSASTPWGIVFFPEEMEDQLDVPNNPQWIDRRQTVLHGGFWEIVFEEGDDPPPVTWAGFAIEESGWVDTGAFLGWVYPLGNYVFVSDIEGWMFLPETHVDADGAWAFPIR
ncbi:MAG: hypothetical protein JJU00_12795 [Opitutales bacterium]|nr:hypothetical protein [Opitutales bacterium]